MLVLNQESIDSVQFPTPSEDASLQRRLGSSTCQLLGPVGMTDTGHMGDGLPVSVAVVSCPGASVERTDLDIIEYHQGSYYDDRSWNSVCVGRLAVRLSAVETAPTMAVISCTPCPVTVGLLGSFPNTQDRALGLAALESS